MSELEPRRANGTARPGSEGGRIGRRSPLEMRSGELVSGSMVGFRGLVGGLRGEKVRRYGKTLGRTERDNQGEGRSSGDGGGSPKGEGGHGGSENEGRWRRSGRKEGRGSEMKTTPSEFQQMLDWCEEEAASRRNFPKKSRRRKRPGGNVK